MTGLRGLFGSGSKVQPILCAVAVGGENPAFLMGAYDGTILRVDKGSRKVAAATEAHKGPVYALCTYPGAEAGTTNFLSGGRDGLIKKWDSELTGLDEEGEELTLQGREAYLTSTAVRALCVNTFGDARKVVVGTAASEIVELSMLDGRDINSGMTLVSGHSRRSLWGLSVHPAKPLYATVGDDMVLKEWSITNRRQVRQLQLDDWGRVCTYSPNGLLIAVAQGGPPPEDPVSPLAPPAPPAAATGDNSAPGGGGDEEGDGEAQTEGEGEGAPTDGGDADAGSPTADAAAAVGEAGEADAAEAAVPRPKSGCIKIVSGMEGQLRLVNEVADCSSGWVTDVKFSPDGSKMGCTASDGNVYLYDVHENFTLFKVLDGAPHPLHRLDFSQDGGWIRAVTSIDPGHSNDSEILKRARTSAGLVFYNVDSGECLAGGSGSGAEKDLEQTLWATCSCTLGKEVRGAWPVSARDPMDVTAICRSKDGTLLLSGHASGDVHLSSSSAAAGGSPSATATGTAPFKAFKGHGAAGVRGAVFTASDSHVITIGGRDRCVFQWGRKAAATAAAGESPTAVSPPSPSAESGTEDAVLRRELQTTASAVASADEQQITNPSTAPVCAVVSATSSDYLQGCNPSGDTPGGRASLGLTPDGRVVLTRGACGAVFDKLTKTQIVYSGHRGVTIISLALTPAGDIAATGDASGAIKLWSTRTGEEVLSLPLSHSGPVTRLSFSGDGKKLASVGGDSDNTLVIHSSPSGRWSDGGLCSSSSKGQAQKVLFVSWTEAIKAAQLKELTDGFAKTALAKKAARKARRAREAAGEEQEEGEAEKEKDEDEEDEDEDEEDDDEEDDEEEEAVEKKKKRAAAAAKRALKKAQQAMAALPSHDLVTGGVGHMTFWSLSPNLTSVRGVFRDQDLADKAALLTAAVTVGSRTITATASGHLLAWEGLTCVESISADVANSGEGGGEPLYALAPTPSGGVVSVSKSSIQVWDSSLRPRATMAVDDGGDEDGSGRVTAVACDVYECRLVLGCANGAVKEAVLDSQTTFTLLEG